VLFWEVDLGIEEDASYYVVGRGLSDAQLTRIARSARPGYAPSVPASALPAGWTRVASAPPLPRQTESAPFEVDLVAPGNRWTYVLAYRLSPGAAMIDGFVDGLQRASSTAQFAAVVSAQRHFGSATVLVLANAPSPTLASVTQSIASVNRNEWRRFQATK
jgi:hypothetical protein